MPFAYYDRLASKDKAIYRASDAVAALPLVRHKRVVAFRTFLRTLLHEVGHHLDYEHLRLADSFHTEGFFKRESTDWPRGDR